jgi:hypothetical protein
MLGRLMAFLGIGVAGAASAAAAPPYAPYAGATANDLYNLLYCDEPAAFEAQPGQGDPPWQAVLFGEPAKVPALLALAEDATQEGRIRYLAYAKLRALGQTVPEKRLLGVIVEVPLDRGLDVLAAFSDGGVRYINHSGKIGVYEAVDSIGPKVRGLFAASEPLVARIGPWGRPRRPPPPAGSIRLTFLVSDGLYFGEGPMGDMLQETLAAPVIRSATELLQAVTGLAGK